MRIKRGRGFVNEAPGVATGCLWSVGRLLRLEPWHLVVGGSKIVMYLNRDGS